ncbi:MAG: prenyltransferase [Bacteroidales bacterium]|nr:prenyltransferase [Bacteroidales bacterium]
MNNHKTTIAEWIHAFRPWTWAASIMPVTLTSAYAFYLQKSGMMSVEWWLLPLILLAVIAYQSGMNMASDLDDFKWRVDTTESLGEEKLLVSEKSTEKPWRKVYVCVLGFGTLIGFFLAYHLWQAGHGLHLLWLGGFGLISGYYYIYFKKYGLGDLLIFTIFGPLITLGTFYVLTGQLSLMAVLIAIPTGLINCGILHANHTRDISYDIKAGIHSLASMAGFRSAQWLYAIFVFGAYLGVGILIVLNILPLTSLLVLLVLPIAIVNVKTMFKASSDDPKTILTLDEMTGKLQVAFTGLLSLGIFIHTLIWV